MNVDYNFNINEFELVGDNKDQYHDNRCILEECQIDLESKQGEDNQINWELDQDENNVTDPQHEQDKNDTCLEFENKDQENNDEDISKLYVAMRFNSEDAAYKYYNVYARQVGFSVRKGPIRRSMKDKSIIGHKLLCSKEGFKEERFKNNKKRKKMCCGETRVGCRARLFINKSEDGSWIVSLFEENHNHECVTPKKSICYFHKEVSLKVRGRWCKKWAKQGLKWI